MIAFINSLTGTEMLVADDRKEEYLAAGHILAVSTPAKKAETVEEKPKAEPKKVEVKKAAPKKAPAKKSAVRKK